MGAFFTAILSKIVSFAGYVGALAVACFAALWLLGTDLGAWVFDQLLTVVETVLDSFTIDFSIFNPAQYISGLPPELVNIMGLCRIGESLGIIAAAVGIKVLLQLVPFTRLGS